MDGSFSEEISMKHAVLLDDIVKHGEDPVVAVLVDELGVLEAIADYLHDEDEIGVLLEGDEG